MRIGFGNIIRPHPRMRGRNGFTLLEIIVVIGIITLMVGIIVPILYRVWESQEVDTTKDRMIKLKEAMVGNASQISNGVRTNFGFVGDLGQLPPDLDALISYGTFGPYLSGGINSQSFKQDAWGNNFIYTYTLDAYGRRASAVIISLGSDHAVGGSGTAADIQLSIDSNEVLSASAASCNILLRYGTPPASTFNASITVHIDYKNGEGANTEQTFTSPVTIIGSSGNTGNNYTFGLSTFALSQQLPVGIATVWAETDHNSSGALLSSPVAGSPVYITVNDRATTIYVNDLSISVP
jgi:prepilin-type N-terminal cleavage/methylation domain-containing protein